MLYLHLIERTIYADYDDVLNYFLLKYFPVQSKWLIRLPWIDSTCYGEDCFPLVRNFTVRPVGYVMVLLSGY